jgi:hypothetical protein
MTRALGSNKFPERKVSSFRFFAEAIFAFVGERVQWPVERRELKFPVPEERYVSDRGVVVFWGQDGNKRVRCEISREALEDHFGADRAGLIRTGDL